MERAFSQENADTWNTLKAFSKKYSAEKGSWRSCVVVEIKAFQKYDAVDFRQYLKLKFLQRNSSMAWESGVDNNAEIGKSCHANSSPSIGFRNPINRKGPLQKLQVSIIDIEDFNFVSNQSSDLGQKIRSVFTFGFNKDRRYDSPVTERTRTILGMHEEVKRCKEIGT